MKLGFSGYFLDKPATGSGQYSINLLRQLPHLLSGEILVFCPTETALASARAFVKNEGSACRLTPLLVEPALAKDSNLGKVWFEQITLPLACRRHDVDLLHVPYFGSPLLSPCPVAVTVHDLIMMVLPQHRGSLLVRLYTALAAAAARRAAIVLADSECSRRDILRLLAVPQERVRVAPLACDERFAPLSDQGMLEDVRRRYSMPERFVYYIGGLDWRKNVDALIRAFARVPDAWQLAIAGEPLPRSSSLFVDLPEVATDAGIEGRVRFLGRVAEEDKPALYALAELFVFPSRYEGFGLTVLEAMACGTPVLSSNAASLPEVVGDGAVLFSPDDEDALALQMLSLLADAGWRDELRRRGLAQADRFSWRKTAEMTVAAYEEALNAQLDVNRPGDHSQTQRRGRILRFAQDDSDTAVEDRDP